MDKNSSLWILPSNYLIVVSAGHLNKDNIGTLSPFECATIIGEYTTLKTLFISPFTTLTIISNPYNNKNSY